MCQLPKLVGYTGVRLRSGTANAALSSFMKPMCWSFDPERVRDHRQNIKMALGSCLKTAKIMCKFVELPCFHCPAYVLTPDDLPALEVYEQQILERIAIGRPFKNGGWLN
jgi:hypothetical protein